MVFVVGDVEEVHLLTNFTRVFDNVSCLTCGLLLI